MIKGIYNSGTGMQPRMTRLEVLANNIANSATTGYKRDSLFIQAMKDAGLSQVEGLADLKGLDSKQFTDFSEGSFAQTHNPLDLAIQGKGFFVVETPQGIKYTRNGGFSLSQDGTVVNAEGYPVLSTSGHIQIPRPEKAVGSSITINERGEVTVGKAVLGQLRIADFRDMSQLRKAGQTMFTTDAPEQRAAVDGHSVVIRQGFLEESNVEALGEMIQLVELSRSFETDQRTIKAQDTTLERALDVGRV
ncbi:MAG: flagellar basal-body rod protein FlgF [Ignavibacteriales bacterium]|nr:flagellar basal-body rod protein FlgF [Ignavibacteriales bacterium]